MRENKKRGRKKGTPNKGRRKVFLSIRVDADTLEQYKRLANKGYQSLMNEALQDWLVWQS